MAMFDYLVAKLQCPRCGHTAPADPSTNMQTRLRLDACMQSLGVGDPLSFNQRDAVEANYTVLQPWQPDESVHLLDSWSCPHCLGDDLWAEVTIENGRIRAIENVRLEPALLERVHLVCELYNWK